MENLYRYIGELYVNMRENNDYFNRELEDRNSQIEKLKNDLIKLQMESSKNGIQRS